MKGPYKEEVAIHFGPESCVVAREGKGEALTGVCVGRAIEPRNVYMETPVTAPEGNTGHRVIASDGSVTRGLRTRACAEPFHTEAGRSPQ